MGFFSNLGRSLTGNWADVSLDVGTGQRGESVPITVHLHVRDEAIDVSKVSVKVRCQESVQVPEHRAAAPGTNGRSAASTTTPRTTTTLFDREVLVASAERFEAGSDHTFTAEVSLPSHAPPSVEGRNARFEWQAFASVDMKGNDPDSGWQTFEVR